jgi:cytidylate kinase
MQTTLEEARSSVASQLADEMDMPSARRRTMTGPSVTISHQTGAGAHALAERLAKILQRSEGNGVQEWAVIDRDLVETALEEHHLPRQLARKMPEDKRSYLNDVLDDLFGLRPPSWVLVPQVVKTILRLAGAGHVVLIGRGATFVTGEMANVFHVRVVASLATRVNRTQVTQGLTADEARKFVEKEDRGRQRYLRAYFHARLDDELLCHMMVNTDRLSFEDAAGLIAEGALRYFRASESDEHFVSDHGYHA